MSQLIQADEQTGDQIYNQFDLSDRVLTKNQVLIGAAKAINKAHKDSDGRDQYKPFSNPDNISILWREINYYVNKIKILTIKEINETAELRMKPFKSSHKWRPYFSSYVRMDWGDLNVIYMLKEIHIIETSRAVMNAPKALPPEIAFEIGRYGGNKSPFVKYV